MELIGGMFIDFTLGLEEKAAIAAKLKEDPIRDTIKLRSSLGPNEDKVSEAEAKVMNFDYQRAKPHTIEGEIYFDFSDGLKLSTNISLES